jgi:hypothetical protein
MRVNAVAGGLLVRIVGSFVGRQRNGRSAHVTKARELATRERRWEVGGGCREKKMETSDNKRNERRVVRRKGGDMSGKGPEKRPNKIPEDRERRSSWAVGQNTTATRLQEAARQGERGREEKPRINRGGTAALLRPTNQ